MIFIAIVQYIRSQNRILCWKWLTVSVRKIIFKRHICKYHTFCIIYWRSFPTSFAKKIFKLTDCNTNQLSPRPNQLSTSTKFVYKGLFLIMSLIYVLKDIWSFKVKNELTFPRTFMWALWSVIPKWILFILFCKCVQKFKTDLRKLCISGFTQ